MRAARLANLQRINMVETIIIPVLENALRNQIIQPAALPYAGGAVNLYELWVNNLGDRFHNMGTFLRIGTEMERGFRECYMEQKGYANLQALAGDKTVTAGVFQRVRGKNTLQELYKTQLGIDLEAISAFSIYKEYMISRHLYAHQGGLIDEKYIIAWQTHTGEDLRQDPALMSFGYPQQDVYWFRPVGRIWDYLNACEEVIRALP